MKTFGLDTNIVLRLLVDDDPFQRQAALNFGKELGKRYNAFLPLIAIIELDWALRSKYRYEKKDVILAIDSLMHTRGIIVESHELLLKALKLVKANNADLADALIWCRALEEGCDATKTFDVKAAKRVNGMELLS